MRLSVRAEVDHLQFLLSLARERHDRQFTDGQPPPIELPVLPDVDELVAELIDPAHPLLGQPDVAPPPVGEPPPRGTWAPPLPAAAAPNPVADEALHPAQPELPDEPEEVSEPPSAGYVSPRDGAMSALLHDLEERLFATAPAAEPGANGDAGASYRRAADAPDAHWSELDDDPPGARPPGELDDEPLSVPAASELDDDPPPTRRLSELDAVERATATRARSELDDEPADPDDDPLATVGGA